MAATCARRTCWPTERSMRWLRRLLKPPRVAEARMLSSLAAAVRIAVGDRAVLRVRGEGTGHVGGVAVDGVFDVIVTVPIVEGHARLSCRGALPRRALRVPVVAIAACPAPPVVAPSVNAAVHVPAFTVALEVPP